MRIEEITAGISVIGLAGDEPVKIIAVNNLGCSVLDVTYRDSTGTSSNKLLYSKDYDSIRLAEETIPYTFDAEGLAFKLTAEAYRLKLAYMFDPFIAMRNSEITPLPHQISAVYQEMLPRLPLRFVLADDPGAGKTIMAGLFIKELIMRGDVQRCLIVTPGSLAEQWQDELRRKFHLHFSILDGEIHANYYIARLDKLARNEKLQAKVKAVQWDVIIVDEAHKMSASVSGNEVKYTKRFHLGRMLSAITRHFLLLTATPHNGKPQDFQLFMSLIDSDRYEGANHNHGKSVDVSDVMRRLLKEELLKFDGTPLFPERIAYTVDYSLSELEAELYDKVTEYVRKEFNRADKLNNKRRHAVGFALTILQRRLASSPEAICKSLQRRREKLEERLRLHLKAKDTTDFEEYDADEDTRQEATEDEAVNYVSAAQTEAELRQEISTLRELEAKAQATRDSGEDRKWQELSRILTENTEMFASDGKREKLIIFTEHRDTLNYLLTKIRALLGDNAAVCIHGSMSRDERRKAERMFNRNDAVKILIATDAAGEGINLHRAHLMVNYDISWNPNRLEQRFGRIHRIGQTEVCHLWNLVARDTREGEMLQRLFSKLEEERKALGGKVFDILGKLTFGNKSLNDLLIEAIRYGNNPAVRQRLSRSVDNSLQREQLLRLLNERALTRDTLNLRTIRGEIDRNDLLRLQPYFVSKFFVAAFRYLGGKISSSAPGVYSISHVPPDMRRRRPAIAEKYERVTFTKDEDDNSEFIAFGRPLLDETIDTILSRNAQTLRRGTVLIDDKDNSGKVRLLFFIEATIQDGTGQTLSKQIHFIETDINGKTRDAGITPYLDYREASQQEKLEAKRYLQTLSQRWADIERKAVNFTATKIIPAKLQEISEERQTRIRKTAAAITERLDAEILFFMKQVAAIQHKPSYDDKKDRIAVQSASARAEELSERRKSRLAELNQQRDIYPLLPVVIGCALIVPAKTLSSQPHQQTTPAGRRAVELAAMAAVMKIEERLGNSPIDVSAQNLGYDIESVSRDGSHRFIEVKGRAKGADTVTVTTGEICTALNSPDNFILAIVIVDGDNTATTYLQRPFTNTPDFAAASVTFSIRTKYDAARNRNSQA